jgi:hypothetical protein
MTGTACHLGLCVFGQFNHRDHWAYQACGRQVPAQDTSQRR